ncbi:uncharacterized protein C8R40DRAFT_1092248 [Lentinula edodes]|uniref:uncharacterized protein n=1 Tax=Lentinula edodes TaxID=5353 RepID=UPI001E8D3F2D|nr:uncharacterized protein C8R40DRAFT_1100464 [Lentinula edodes]XP_046089475.1 uncharacterized protein C8R40DRAFT_1092248 [Lentinula edodes]KAH7876526.1 hypothetical protein C8R40DRAFT_1100464 [Lentinula edodes]KAH7878381.1 hypothetical protein C8R40DRAFT_1092248 [Lentinula edodes]
MGTNCFLTSIASRRKPDFQFMIPMPNLSAAQNLFSLSDLSLSCLHNEARESALKAIKEDYKGIRRTNVVIAAHVEQKILLPSHLSPHAGPHVREMHTLAHAQLLVIKV